jgi:zeaxanthin glucosyltransferase
LAPAFTIVFMLDVEEGHFFPTVKLAKDLRDRGHRILYLGLPSAERLVCQQGFTFIPILGDVLADVTRSAAAAPVGSKLDLALLRGNALDGLIERLRPDAMVLPSLYYLEALLIRHRYRVPIVLLTAQLRSARRAPVVEQTLGERLAGLKPDVLSEVLGSFNAGGYRLRSFRDLAQLVLRMPELILVPQAFDLPELVSDPDITYIGTGVDLVRTEEPFPWDALDARLPLVYASLGSQCDVEADLASGFFRCVIATAEARPDLQFALSVSKGFAASDFPTRSANVYVSSWMPQMTALSRASLMLNHAGIGTVKECILSGVPMVALPLMRDQFDCAERIVHHGLGVQGDLARLTPGLLSSLIDMVAGEPAFRQRVAVMRERCAGENDSQRGVKVVEAAAAS